MNTVSTFNTFCTAPFFFFMYRKNKNLFLVMRAQKCVEVVALTEDFADHNHPSANFLLSQ